MQSLLPVEFEIHGIHDIDTANDFLNSYIYAFNSEFAVEPQDCENTFLPLDEEKNPDHILCIKEQRTLDNGQVFSFKGKYFQIVKAPYSEFLPPKAKITLMISPRIGIKVAYLRYVFDTCPVQAKPTVKKESAPAAIPAKPPVTKQKPSWEPKTGLAWEPGQPTYQESLNMIYEIFNMRYPNYRKLSHEH